LDRGAIASSFSKLFATSFAPDAFLLRPLTVTAVSETTLTLLPCVVAASATPVAPPHAIQLAQTGASPADRPWALLAALFFLLAGLVTSMRTTKRSGRL
jgi:hypothetical protein